MTTVVPQTNLGRLRISKSLLQASTYVSYILEPQERNTVLTCHFQGVGETLRGTLNSSIDSRFGHASPETLAHNQQTLDAGRAEIETGRFDQSFKEREKAHTVGKIMRKPVNQDGMEESGNLRVVNQ